MCVCMCVCEREIDRERERERERLGEGDSGEREDDFQLHFFVDYSPSAYRVCAGYFSKFESGCHVCAWHPPKASPIYTGPAQKIELFVLEKVREWEGKKRGGWGEEGGPKGEWPGGGGIQSYIATDGLTYK